MVGESPPEDWFKVLEFVRRGEGVSVGEFEERWPKEAEVVEKFRHRREVVGSAAEVMPELRSMEAAPAGLSRVAGTR